MEIAIEHLLHEENKIKSKGQAASTEKVLIAKYKREDQSITSVKKLGTFKETVMRRRNR